MAEGYKSNFTSATKIETPGWFEKYVSTLKGCCRWCQGDKRITLTLGDRRGKTIECPRCKGTGDEPHCDDPIRKRGVTDAQIAAGLL